MAVRWRLDRGIACKMPESKWIAGCVVVSAIVCIGLAWAVPANAQASCGVKASEGTGATSENAKFQIYEALLQATDWGAWASWMSNGTTPGYKVSRVSYTCVKGTGLGVTCRGQAKICKI